MWTNLTLTIHPVWEDLHWSATATWQDDDAAEPVTLHQTGVTPARGLKDPEQLFRAAVAALQHQRTIQRLRDERG